MRVTSGMGGFWGPMAVQFLVRKHAVDIQVNMAAGQKCYKLKSLGFTERMRRGSSNNCSSRRGTHPVSCDMRIPASLAVITLDVIPREAQFPRPR